MDWGIGSAQDDEVGGGEEKSGSFAPLRMTMPKSLRMTMPKSLKDDKAEVSALNSGGPCLGRSKPASCGDCGSGD